MIDFGSGQGPIVTILSTSLTSYREKLYRELLGPNCSLLEVYYDRPKASDYSRGIYVDGSDARFSAGPRLRHVTFLRENRDCDILVVEFALRLVNLWLLLLRRPKSRVLLWGHFKAGKSRIATSLRVKICHRAQSLGYRFITYSAEHKQFLVGRGIDASRVSVAMNGYLSDSVISEARRTYISDAAPIRIVGVPGSLYATRVDDVWIEKVRVLAEKYEVRVFGGGQMATAVQVRLRANGQVKFFGPLKQEELIRQLSLCDALILLKPVGGLIIECAATGLPVIMEEHDQNGPEVKLIHHPNLVRIGYDESSETLLNMIAAIANESRAVLAKEDAFRQFDEFQKSTRESFLSAFLGSGAS